MSFPTTGILDNFNRSNVGPPPSANWSGVFSGSMTAQVSSNTLIPSSASADCYGYWNPVKFGPDCEVYITIKTIGASSDKWILAARYQDSGLGTASPNGYEVDWAVGGTSVRIRRRTSGSGNTLATITASFANGDVMGMSIVGTVITAYKNGTSLGNYDTVSDGTKYTNAGWIGVDLNTASGGTTMVADDFGGGSYVVSALSFPNTPILDTFASNDYGTNWTDFLAGWGITGGQAIMSNTVNVQLGYWSPAGTPLLAGNDAEVYATLSQRAGTATDETNVGLDFTGSVEGYFCTLIRGTPDLLCIERRDPGGPNYLVQISQNVSVGDSVGLRRVGSTMNLYYKPSAGSWSIMATCTDSTYVQSGVLCLVGFYTTTSGAWQNFGGGTFPVVANTANFRRTLSRFGSAVGKRQTQGWGQ